MSDLLDNLNNILSEEKYTRTTINSYTIKNFEDLDAQIDRASSEGKLEEALKLTDDYLQNNKNSIVALYLNSFINFRQGNYDNTNILSLLKIFSDNFRWSIVEYLCNETLKRKDEDATVLRILIETCINLNKTEDIVERMEHLIQIDTSETEYVLKLADEREKAGNIEGAKAFYKKALNRYIEKENYSKVEDLWKKLLTFDDLGYDYFLNQEKKITKKFKDDRAIDLLKQLYNVYEKKEDIDVCLKILKVILKKSPSDDYARAQIVDVYRKKYQNHSLCEEFIKKSVLMHNSRDVNQAIADFERHIAFEKGNFVYHKAWGIGRIIDITDNLFTIDFTNKHNHKMSLDMALDSLKVLPKNHIWILKLKDIKRLKTALKEDPTWGLKILINSYDNKATMKNMKEELVPKVFTASEWTSWWTAAKKILKTDPKFGTSDEDNDVYEIKDKPLTYEDKCYASFKGLKDFDKRFDIIIDFLENIDSESENLRDMLVYFVQFITPEAAVDEKTICSYLMLNNALKQFPELKNDSKLQIPQSFADYYNNLEDPIVTYGNISIKEYKKGFLMSIKKYIAGWDDIFMKIFFLYPDKYIFDELVAYNPDNFDRILKEVLLTYKERRDAFAWVVINTLTPERIEKYNIEMDKVLFSMLHLVDISGKDVQNKKDVTHNKRVFTQARDYLFKNNILLENIDKLGLDFSKRLYLIVNDIRNLDNEYSQKVKDAIIAKYPELDQHSSKLKYSDDKHKSSILDKLLTTQKSFKEKQQLLTHIVEVDIPANAKDIGLASEKGDLKENSEYKAAKDKEKELAAAVTTLTADLGRAKVLKPSDVKSDFISFGTVATLYDNIAGKEVVYTIMGPWESDVDNKVFSYLAPLAQKLLDKEVGDKVDFTLNGIKHSYEVKKIEVAKF